MPLHMTKIAFGAKSYKDLESWYRRGASEPKRLTTRYLPKRHEELVGGSLYWILNHALVARSQILGFSKTDDGRWNIELEPVLVRVHPQPKRAHQGWRYLKGEPPRDLAPGEDIGDALPGKLAAKLEKLALI
ncbi:DUF1489 family protein [Erythrobacter rubeus]|uniref:DUF1489 domain-containing protein n=1 Tax=Erythrobacter rubeus TaxID=2760803 RepID=A0ABR8KLR6_9SPHN|nr:DUF1489 domain-containing protein [Erythrobacter rubeus]MBD2841345.1 DUF1489 domain-containing protein [Erythrobacter rubeus]